MSLIEEGQEIARKLGGEVIYEGPWFPYGPKGEFLGHFFTNGVTGSTFVAKTLEEAKATLIQSRKDWGEKPPVFPNKPSVKEGKMEEEEAIRQIEMFGLSRDEAKRFLAAPEAERRAIIKKAGVIAELPAFYYKSLMPMSPEEGPPLPRRWGVKWPWKM